MRALPPRCALALVATTLLVALLVPAGAAGAAPRDPEVGVQLHAMWIDMDTTTRRATMDLLAAAGTSWIRVDVGWSSLEEDGPEPDPYWTGRTREVLSDARARGLEVLVTLWRTPSWENGDAGVYAPPRDAGQYERFTRWFAGEFGDLVGAYEIWNEPNQSDFFEGTAADYVRVLKAGYRGLHAGDPNATVVLGGPAYNDTDWLAEVYAAGAQGYFDVMSTHPYLAPSDAAPETEGDEIWLLTHVAAVKRLMDRYGDSAKPIWFTEFGWFTQQGPTDQPWDRPVTEQQQGEYLVRTIDLVAERYPYVTHVFWYNARDRDSGNPRNDSYGLLRRDLTPKPVYQALKARLAATTSDTDRHASEATAPAPTTSTAGVRRVAGTDRVATAVAAATSGWTAGSAEAVIARADHPADALTGSTLAAARNAPLLLTDRDRLHPQTADALRRLQVRKVHVLGGTAAISDTVVKAIRGLGIAVERVAGRDRASTAVAIADRLGARPGGTVLVARGYHRDAELAWPDALATTALAVRTGAPVLLVSDDVPDATDAALEALAPSEVLIVGADTTMPYGAIREMQSRGVTVRRVGDRDRYATSVAAADAVPGSTRAPLVVVTGAQFPDALAGGALAARVQGRMVMVPPTLEGLAAVRDWVAANRDEIGEVIVLGGEKAVPETVLRDLLATG